MRQSATSRAGADDPEARTAEPDGADGPVLVGLAVPATWNSTRRRAHAEAAANAGFDASFLVLEPEAAARQFAEVQDRRSDPGAPLVVCNLGAASCHVAVVRREGERYKVEAAKSADDIGGRAFDQLLLDHLADRFRQSGAEYWARVQNPGETALRAEVLEEVRRARERLSEQPATTVDPPGLERVLRLSREDADQCLTPAVLRIVSLIEDALREAGVETDQIAALLLLGGASRTPLITSVVGHHLGVEPVRPELPDLVIAEGVALAGLARIGKAEAVEEPAAAGRLTRLRTSPDVLVAMAVVVLAFVAIVGVALLDRGDSDPRAFDTDSLAPSAPDMAGGAESGETASDGAEEESAGEPTSPEPPVTEESTGGQTASPSPATTTTTTATATAAAPTTQESLAPQAAEAAVPDIVGEPLAEAERLLAEAGFTNVVAEGERSGSGAPGYDRCEVTAQSPAGGSRHPRHAQIVIDYVYIGSDTC
ncbi:Hsp70 family protein [Glycomyces tenuis]|uniref:Hsp70 family protein n=1 Tax=Glycomyces tenuis TaxID=58116 RepID=UPI00040E35CB|nr:Hsp70 family protein [Glycomyces tenuis]